MSASDARIDTDSFGEKAAVLSSIEIALGSVLHGFQVPGGGHFLSLNQGFLLTRASIELRNPRAAGMISTTAAVLKSWSPAGKKLTPMLAIAVQGHLYGASLFLFGNNFFGHLLGMTFLVLWGFIQPLTLYFILFGNRLISMLEFYLGELNLLFPVSMDDVVKVLVGLVLIKCMLGWALVILAHRLPETWMDRYRFWARSKKQNRATETEPQKNPYVAALRDLLHPLFIASVLLMAVFFLFSNSPHATLIWVLLRPIALAYLLFLIIRLTPVEALIEKLKTKNPNFAKTLASAVQYLKSVG